MQTIQKIVRAPWIAFFWPVLAIAFGWREIIRKLGDPVLFDSQWVYLPAARAFMEQGWAFLLTPQSYRVVPLAYLWPALWGADPQLIRMANMGVWAACVWFLWRTCCLLGGLRTGALAMLLLLASHEMVRYFPSEMTEPIYLLGVFGWMHAMARLMIGREWSWVVVAQAAVMLTIMLLSRPILQLIAPLALLACLALLTHWALFKKIATHGDLHACVRCLTWSLAIGMAAPLALVIKNGLVFGLWGLGTGAGVALYLGTHPLFQGTEPAFLGFDYDVSDVAIMIAGTADQLSVAGDKALRQVGLWHIQSMPLADAIAFFARKLWWLLMHHPTSIDTYGSSLRKVRLLEFTALILLFACAWSGWRLTRRKNTVRSYTAAVAMTPSRNQWIFAILLLSMFWMVCVQLIPVLYNSRYSSTLLDPWLLPLTAFAMSCLIAPLSVAVQLRSDAWNVSLTCPRGIATWKPMLALVVLATLPFLIYRHGLAPSTPFIDPAHLGRTAQRWQSMDAVTTHGMAMQGPAHWQTTASPSVLMIDVPPQPAGHMNNPMWLTDLSLQAPNHEACRNAEIAFQLTNGQIVQPTYRLPLLLPLKSNGKVQTLATHARGELSPSEPGKLRIVLHCPIGTTVQWHGTRLLESLHPQEATEHFKH